MSESTYKGSCHCGAVRIEVTMEAPTKAYACNCSICARAGWLLAFAPRAAMTIVSGEDALTDYQFAKQTIHHEFCSVCGMRPFSHGADPSGGETVSINLRCLEGFDASALPVESFDGASL